MNPVVLTKKSLGIVYDADVMDAPNSDYFDVDFWRSQQLLNGEAKGRGSAWFIDSPFGPVVLRQYLRGGWAAKFSRQGYFFTSVSRSRPFREFYLLAALCQKGLPVPRPVAALIQHHGMISTGAILTARISSAQTLADIFTDDHSFPGRADNFWSSVGQCVRQFHNAGVWHADLNARNILVNADWQISLIDFDRARYKPGKVINGQANLNRLKRSLDKLWPQEKRSDLKPAWDQLLAGYHE